jgi:CBS-domain-containing membrane protein
MDVNARTIMPDTDLLRIATIFRSTPYRQLPVVSGLDLVGLVSRRDVLLATRRMMAKSPQREQTFLYLSAIAGREAVNLD